MSNVLNQMKHLKFFINFEVLLSVASPQRSRISHY
jgi:hypothetical protein